MGWGYGRSGLRAAARGAAVALATGALSIGFTGAASAAPASPAPPTQTAVGNAAATSTDPLVKVQPADKDASEAKAPSASADGGGHPKGYTGLLKLTGLIMFLAFAWGWWAWGGDLPARTARS